MDTILVVNAGSSTVKFQVFAVHPDGVLKRQIKGLMEGIGTRPRLRASDAEGNILVERSFGVEDVADVPAALQMAGAWLRDAHNVKPVAIGHRVVHGGPKYDRPILIDRQALRHLERYAPLAPLHQSNNLAPIRSICEQFPQLPQVACFDTAFHHGHIPVADHYAIPESLYAEGVRRYGFHGLSDEYVSSHLPQIAPEIAGGRVIVAHLGSGSSMCALSAGRSIESTLGFTALDGLPMGTRSGQLDPGVVLYLLQEKGMTAAEVQDFLYGECGLKGLSGISNDMRELEASGDPQAAFAIDYFVYRVGATCRNVGGGVGWARRIRIHRRHRRELCEIRARIAEKLAWLGATPRSGCQHLRQAQAFAP